jgi:tRNA pseudouridine55 synthase
VGILNVDKPPGLTSAAVVARLRRSSGVTRVGHGGTLDPAATGVLPIFLGRATVLADWLSRQGKSYLAGIRLGMGSDTDDAQGSLAPAALPTGIDEARVATALAAFRGEVLQQPPAFSAVKVEGQRSYRRARLGDSSLPPARSVRVHSIQLLEIRMEPAGPLAVVEVDCGPGFYVRSLARDLGTSLGTRALLASLSRTRVGCLGIEDAISLAELEEAAAELGRFVQPAAAALADVPSVRVATDAAADLRMGRSVVVVAAATEEAYATDDRGRVLAIGRVLGGHFHPHRLVEA